jgi:hypothetical protein
MVKRRPDTLTYTTSDEEPVAPATDVFTPGVDGLDDEPEEPDLQRMTW